MDRDISIDYLRTIGLLCIILAHVNPPSLIQNLRTFDVPFMVVISGLLYRVTSKKQESIFHYIYKRAVRLIAPVYIFLTIYFLLLFFITKFNIINFNEFKISKKLLLGSYGMISGIGYVWIIRIYFMIALLAKPSVKIFEKIKNKYSGIILYYIILYYIIYQTSIIIYEKYVTIPHKYLFSILIIAPLGYLLFFLIGYFYEEISQAKKKILVLFLGLFILSTELISWIKFGKFISINSYKYPQPQYIYLYYAVIVSIVLLSIRKIFNKELKIVSFIGSSTIWIYLWHIIPVQIFMKLKVNWLLSYILIIVIAMIITYIQQRIIELIIKRFNVSLKKQKFMRIIFCG